MQYHKTNLGFSTLEILLALVLFTSVGIIISATSISLTEDARNELLHTQALSFAEEGIVAFYSMRDIDTDNLVAGTHGVVFENGAYILSGSEDTHGIFTRELSIEKNDFDTFLATSTVRWEGSQESAVTLVAQTHDVYETYGASAYVTPSSGSATWNLPRTHLQDVELTNSDNAPHEVITLLMTWEGSGKLKEISFASSTVFSTATSSAMSSGERIDISDYTLGATETVATTDFIFTDTVATSAITIQLELEDNSVRNSFHTIDL